MKRLAAPGLLLLLASALAFGPARRAEPTHWALVVGISDYVHLDDVEGGDLPGAEHDARAMRDVLVDRWGFPEENVRLLLNGDATRAALEEAVVGWLGGNAAAGDNVVVFFAGHGSQMWDESGDEEDGLDETLAPADVSPAHTGRDISDDAFGEWLQAIASTNVVLVLDHGTSGRGSRTPTPFSRARLLGRDVGRLPVPGETAREQLPAPPLDETGFDPGGPNVLELSAAQPHQAAVDAYFPGEAGAGPFHGGAFTTYLVRALWRAPAGRSYEDVFRDVARALERNRFQQAPHLSSDVSLRSLPLFFVEGGSGGGPGASLPVRAVEEGAAVLGGGSALGLASGSVFVTGGGATLVVDSVGPGSARARVARGTAEAGDTARLVGHRYPLRPLRVGTAAVDSADAAALAAALRANPAVQLVPGTDDFSHLLLSPDGDGYRLVGSDGFLRRGGIPAGDGGLLAEVLRHEAAAKTLADMENPAQPFAVELRLEGDRTSFGVGERISFHVTSEQAGYLTLVELGTDGTVVMLFPNESRPVTSIGAGETLSFPTAEMGFDLQVIPPAGRGMVRAFVTSRPLRLPVEGAYPEGDEGFAHEIVRGVMEAAGSVEGAVRLDGWAAASLVYEIRD